MPPKTGTERSRDDGEGMRAREGKKLSSWLLKLMGDRALSLASRSRLDVTMPPLASHVWQQVGHLRQQSNQLVRRATNYIGRTSSQVMRSFTLNPAASSPVLQRLLDLTWLRQRRKGQLANVAGEAHPDEPPAMMRFTAEEQLFSPANELYPMIIENPLSPPAVKIGPAVMITGPSHPTDAASVHPKVQQIVDEPGIKEPGESITPYISPIKTPGLNQADRIHRPGYQQIKTRLDKQPQRTFPSRPPAGILAPLAQQSAIYRTPITKSSHIIRQSIFWAQTISERHRPYPTATGERAELRRQPVQQPTPAYPASIAKITGIDDKTPQILDNYARPVDLEMATTLPASLPDRSRHVRPVDLEMATTLPASLPDRSRHARPGRTPERLSQSSIPKTTGSFREAPLNLPILNKEADSSLPTIEAASPQALEIRQTEQPISLTNLLPQRLAQRVKATYVPEDAVSMAHGPITVPVSPPDNISLSQEQSASLPTPLTDKEHPPAVRLHRQPQPVTESVDRTPAIAEPLSFKPAASTTSPDRKKIFHSLQNIEDKSSPPQYKDTHQQLELMLTSIAGPKMVVKTISHDWPLPPEFEGRAFYGNQPAPELALASVESQAETVSAPSPRTETQIENITGEATAPDIDNIARDVYRILKRRLARERERAWGLS